MWADIETGVALEEVGAGDLAGAVKIRALLGPVGAFKPAGPRGGDRGLGENTSRCGGAERTGDRSLGVDLAESRVESLKGREVACAGGDRSRGSGDLALERSSRLDDCVTAILLGWIGGEERREVSPDVLPEERPESRGAGEGDRRLQVDELGPVGIRSPRRSRLRDRARHAPLGPAGGDLLDGRGDLARGAGRSQSYGDLDLLLLSLESKSSRLGDLALFLLSLSLLGENRLGGLLARGDVLALSLVLQFGTSRGGVRSLALYEGVLDLRRGERSRAPG